MSLIVPRSDWLNGTGDGCVLEHIVWVGQTKIDKMLAGWSWHKMWVEGPLAFFWVTLDKFGTRGRSRSLVSRCGWSFTSPLHRPKRGLHLRSEILLIIIKQKMSSSLPPGKQTDKVSLWSKFGWDACADTCKCNHCNSQNCTALTASGASPQLRYLQTG